LNVVQVSSEVQFRLPAQLAPRLAFLPERRYVRPRFASSLHFIFLAGIADWESERRQKQALKKALDELEKNGFKIEVGQEKIKITRRKGLLGGILEM